MANPSVLTPIGFDTPQLQYAVTPQVAQSLQPDSTPDTTGLNILSEANKSFNQTNQAQSDSYKMQAQAMTAISQGQIAASQALGQAESVNFQAKAAAGQRNIQSLANLTNSVTGLVTGIQAREANAKELVDKAAKAAENKRLADLKIELDNNQVLATTELENLQVDWIEGGKLGKLGTQAYRRAVGDILAKRPMQPDTISTLTSKYYSPALDEAKKQDKLVFDTALKAAEVNRDVLGKQLKIELGVATAGLADSFYGGEGADKPFLKQINDIFTKIQNNPVLGDLDKLTLMSTGLDSVLASSKLSTEGRVQLARVQQGAVVVSNFINENAPKVQDGSLTQSTFDDQANVIRRAFGLPEKDTTAPDKNLRRTITNLESNGTLDSLNRQGFITATEALEGNKKYTRSIALQLFLSPEAIAALKAKDPKLLDVNAKAGIELAEQAIKFYGPTTTARRKSIEDANLALVKLQKADYTTLIGEINKSEQDNVSNSLANSLRGLGLGLPPAPPGRTGITQEQVNFLQANSLAVQRALVDTVNGNSAEGLAYAAEQAKFESMGFSGNRSIAQKNLKAMEGTVVEYNKRLEDIRLKGVKQLTPQKPPGQSPNFNGGSQGVQVPLTRRSFRGVSNVTMPFPVGAANAMPDAGGAGSGGNYHDPRPGRLHEGTDFPVPVGTPALSMVYGTITEIKRWDGTENASYGNLITVRGDDGKEYRYAHLDKITAAMGQRVGPGEKVGFTGQTGATGGAHLHLEVYVGENSMDPLAVLANGKFGQQTRQVRTAGVTAGLPSGEARIDPRAIPLGNGQFFLDGKIIKFAGGPAPAASPVSTSSSATPEVDVYKLPEVNVNRSVHDITFDKSLTPIGWTSTAKSTKKGQPVGYYTFRNAAGGILTQTAYGTGSKLYGQNVGFDGKGYTPPTATTPRPETPPPVEPARVDPSKAGRVFMQRTGEKDENGLEVISVSLFDKQGRPSGSYRVNSGKPHMQGVFGSGGTTIAGSGAPLEYGSYSIGETEAAQDIPGMRSNFVNITPMFKTQRALLGIHFDGNRSTDPGSMGSIVFSKTSDFEAFQSAVKSSGITRLDFSKGLSKVVVVAPKSIPGKMTLNNLNMNPQGSGHLDALRRAIIGQESGGNYRILNPDSGAVGLGQVMPDNIPSWTREALGKSLTVDQFRNDAAAQVKTINFQMGKMFDTALRSSGGDVALAVRKTASEWYSGQQSLYDDARPQTFGAGSYPSIREYTKSVYQGYLKQRGSGNGDGSGSTSTAGKPARPADHRRIPIGGGKFLLNGKIVAAAYTPDAPLQASYASASRFDYKPSEEPDNYGYAQLDRDKPTFEKLNSIAKETGIPHQWLADVAALHGTAGIDGPEELENIAAKLRGVKIKTPTDLVARVLGDASKVTDLGVHAGRRYDSAFSRFERTSAPTHLAIAPDCRLCNQLQDQTAFVPHRAELA